MWNLLWIGLFGFVRSAQVTEEEFDMAMARLSNQIETGSVTRTLTVYTYRIIDVTATSVIRNWVSLG